MRNAIAVLLAGLVLGIMGCGQSGPATKPERPSSSRNSAAAPPPPAAPK